MTATLVGMVDGSRPIVKRDVVGTSMLGVEIKVLAVGVGIDLVIVSLNIE